MTEDVPASTNGPVIVIGMHRSGTALVVQGLERFGMFAGRIQDRNRESIFFAKVNDWLLAQASATWEHPAPFRALPEDHEVRTLLVQYLGNLVRSRQVVSYLGWSGYLRYRRPDRLPGPWGWKDPRTTFTLPLWLDLYPEARVVHVLRNGVDVARSLVLRRAQLLARKRAMAQRSPLRPPRLPWRSGRLQRLTHGPRMASLEGALSLWEEYVAEARRQLSAVGSRGMEIRYETLLAEPGQTLNALSEFCGLPASPEALAAMVEVVRPDRAYAFRQEPEAIRFAESVSDRLRAFGYGA